MLAPSMIARAGIRSTKPRPANDVVIRAVAVLLCRSAVTPIPTESATSLFRSAVLKKCRSSEPKARVIPLRTICSPQRSRATPPIKSRITMLPIEQRLTLVQTPQPLLRDGLCDASVRVFGKIDPLRSGSKRMKGRSATPSGARTVAAGAKSACGHMIGVGSQRRQDVQS
jgi:hypothetical protein